MNNIILESLDYYFEKKTDDLDKYSKPELTSNIVENMPIMKFRNTASMKYNLLGIYDTTSKSFIWAWHLNIEKWKYVKTKQLLLYAMNKDVVTVQDTYIKTLLTQSEITINNYDDVFILMALIIYLTKAHGITNIDYGHKINIYGLYNIDNTGEESI
jgi:hypothetical protein